MKTITLVSALIALALFSSAQQTQPSIHNTPVQYNPLNSYVTAAGSSTAVLTITGVAGQRVRLYSISIWCGGAPGSGLRPSVQITDAGNMIAALPGGMNTSADVYPIGDYHWLPGLTFSTAGTAVVTGNAGNVCTGGTFMNVQADQF